MPAEITYWSSRGDGIASPAGIISSETRSTSGSSAQSGSAWTTIGAGTVASGEAVSLATPTGNKVANWVNLPAGAKADVRFRIAMNGGDAAADPALGLTALQFK